MSPGIYVSKGKLKSSSPLLDSELFLVKFSLNNHNLEVVRAKETLNRDKGSIIEIANKTNALVSINASFFGVDGEALGVLKDRNDKVHGKLQLGGKLLTGVFYIQDGLPKIVHRNRFGFFNELPEKQKTYSSILQAGPRLISQGKPLHLSSSDNKTRRSGIAVTKDKEIVLFATALRFPGASLSDVQIALLEMGIPVMDALNLDGGGSSQLFIRGTDQSQLYISGGDEVPVALVVRKK